MPYPAGDPFEHGVVDVGDGHQVYWERVGNLREERLATLSGPPEPSAR